jgi:hypothetical protein
MIGFCPIFKGFVTDAASIGHKDHTGLSREIALIVPWTRQQVPGCVLNPRFPAERTVAEP